MKDIYLIDAVHLLFRSYYAIRGMTNKQGASTGALYGFIRSIQKLQADFTPAHLCAVFDGPNNKQSRTDLFEDYKANRTGMPEDLIPQLEWAHAFCHAAGIPLLSLDGVEADDTIGSIAAWAASEGGHVYICSSDKDLCQLVTDKITMINTHKGNLRIDADEVYKIYGVHPHQIIDYLAIVGDTSDNIPGIEGFGPKTASTLLQEYTTLENLLDHADEVKGAKKQQALKDGKEKALLSQKLATIDTNLPIPKNSSFYALQAPNNKELITLYSEMNFTSLLEHFEDILEKPAQEAINYTILRDEQSIQEALDALSKESIICFDVESTSLNLMDAEVVGIGLAAKEDTLYYIPWNGFVSRPNLIALFRPFFAKNTFVAHNIKFDMHMLANEGIELRNIGFDTMIASYLLFPETNRHNLDDLSAKHLGITKIPYSDVAGKGKKEKSLLDVPIEDVATYCVEDVLCTLKLYTLFSQEIETENQRSPLETIELPLIPILFKMERSGIHLEAAILEEKSIQIKESLHSLQEEIYALAGEEFNINSPKQLGAILFEKLEIPMPGKKISTRADILEGLKKKYPIVDWVLQYRVLEKLRSTYIDSLPSQVNPKTQRIHCSFNQAGTATGRLSCNNPNLQNIPVRTKEGKAIRTAFCPDKPGYSYLACDYSQIELRLLAHFSEEPTLLKAFREDKDIHAAVASEVFEIPEDTVTREMRSQAKTVNFGILYGQGPYGLSQVLGIEQKKAKAFIEKYFEEYPLVQAFIQKCKEDTKETGVAKTIAGRRRPIPEIHSKNGMLKSAAERLAVNTPLQGSQADIIKMAMIKIDSMDLPGFPVLQIHDELIFEMPTDAIPEAQKKIVHAMETIVPLRVPLKVNIEIGKNWGEC